MAVVVGLCLLVAVCAGLLWFRERAKCQQLRVRFGPIVDLAAEYDRLLKKKLDVEERIRTERATHDQLIECQREQLAQHEDAVRHKLADEERVTREKLADDERTAREKFARHEGAVREQLAARHTKLERDEQTLREHYGPVAELASKSARLHQEQQTLEDEIATRKQRFEEALANVLKDHNRLVAEVAVLETKAELASFAFYAPHYHFDSSERYKLELETIRDQQTEMLKDKSATRCGTEWRIDGSVAKGRQMVNRLLKLQLRAFNGESDAAVSKVKYNNIATMEARVNKSFELINKLGESNDCQISSAYLALKLAELRLTHEFAEKAREEREEQQRIREQMRDEEIAAKELERAQREAEEEEERFAAALAKAKADLQSATALKKQTALQEKVAQLEERLAEAHIQRERAVSRAQLTRSGHVYVISNVGSFGEAVYKVGMTRRHDPMDRVRELGDASVPFSFDVHAVIYSEDAPALESALHRALDAHRVNRVNGRKEFFAVELQVIESVVQSSHGEFEFVRTAAAEEYRKSVAMRTALEAPAANDNAATEIRMSLDEATKLLAAL